VAWTVVGAGTRTAWPAPRPPPGGAFRLAVDQALVDSGLARQLQRAFGGDTGVPIKVVAGAARLLLEEMERGDHDGALLNVPRAEEELQQRGLLRDRVPIAEVDVLLVGPLVLRPALDALDTRKQASVAMAALARVGAAFTGAAEGSGIQQLEADLWRAAKVAPATPWYRTGGLATALTEARIQLACTLVERGAWNAAEPALRRGADFGVLVEGDPALVLPVHAMRAFHSDHPAGALLTKWLGGRTGRRAVASMAAYRPART
jgi:tungstate transport system substrate-binding protein